MMLLDLRGIAHVEVPGQFLLMTVIDLIGTFPEEILATVIHEFQMVGRVELIGTRALFGNTETQRGLQSLKDVALHIQVVGHV